MKKLKSYFILSILTTVVLVFNTFSCSKGDDHSDDHSDDQADNPTEEPQKTLPTVKTNEVYNITWTTAEITGTIVSNGDDMISQNGFCWDTINNPTLSNNFNIDKVQSGDFWCNMENLTQGTLYYVRAYATNTIGTDYGETKTFTTGLSCQQIVERQPGYQVWAGDTPYYQEDNHFEYFYSIDNYDHTLIGSSNSTQTINTGNYKYYVIVANYWSCIDAIQFNDGTYLNYNFTVYSGLSDIEKMLGAPDGISGNLGDITLCIQSNATFNGYITDSGTVSSRGEGLKVIVVDGCQ